MANDRKRWRVEPGRLDLERVDPASTAGAPGDKATTMAQLPALSERLADLQGRLWAEGQRSLLVVLQALDAAGKDGTVKHVFSGLNPMGVHAVAFQQPGDEELAHDFLWRVHREAPRRGQVGIFNRSHYEDVLVVRVRDLVPPKVWRSRYRTIRHFEQGLVSEGTTVVKIFLHISREEQARRFRQRLADPAKRWKFSAADLEVRTKWDDYMAAYHDAISKTAEPDAPWYVVPADRKWYRNWAVSRILIETLEELDPQYPPEAPGLDQLVIE
ncbi:MAG: UDP-galactose-lipid carrier transferase [Acidimicrobiales bacterium]|nr:UDP-galactose-lipid carrier transferase [Acidimicrobiales bacterium]